MRRTRLILPAALALVVALTPTFADARAGSTTSSGSRGSRTYSAPPATNTAPTTAAPMQRTTTTPSAATTGSPAAQAARPGMFGGSPFMSGLMGGLIGAGIGGMLFGGGLTGGMGGAASFIGLLLQIFLVVGLGYMAYRLFTRNRREPAMAGPAGMMRNADLPQDGVMANRGMGGGIPASAPVEITAADFTSFEGVLRGVQAAWTASDLGALRGLSTPEMVSYFGEQLAEQASRGVQNFVTDVKLEQGDLAVAWAEPGREYATVAMRFSMIDVTKDRSGRIVDGDLAQRSMATEVWTFVRAPGNTWLLSAIQQT